MSVDEIYEYLKYGLKKWKRPGEFQYSSDPIITGQRDINRVVIKREGAKVSVFFLNFEDEACLHKDALSSVIKEFIKVGWEAHGFYFLKIEFCIDFCPYEDLNSDGAIDAPLIMARLIAAHKKEFIKRLKPKNVKDPDCLCFTIRTGGAKIFVWLAPDGHQYRISQRYY